MSACLSEPDEGEGEAPRDPSELKAMPPAPDSVTTAVTDEPKDLTRPPPPYTDWTVSLVATPTSLWPGATTTLKATTNHDVGPTPYYLKIFDPEGYVFIASCGSGTTCTVTTTRAVEDYTAFTAYVTDSGGLNQATSFETWVDWHGAGVVLSDPNTTMALGGSSTLTATTTSDIGTSPYYVEIFDVTTGTMLKSCGSGTSCAIAVSQAAATTHQYRAVFSNYSTTYPPSNTLEQTPSHYLTWTSSGDTITLSAPSTTYTNVTVTATSSIDVTTTPYYIQIYNQEGGRIASCGGGTTCSTTFTPTTSGSHLVAFIAPSSTTLPPANAQAGSRNVLTTLLVMPH